MKLILITLLAFAGSFAHADDEEDPTGPNSYAGTMARLHGYVERARDALLADLQKPYNDADPVAPDFDEDLFKKIILDEQKFNDALWHLQNPEDPGPSPFEPKPTKHHHH
jgi:hypothetical protein